MSDLSKIDYLNLSPDKIKRFLIDNLNKTKVFTDQIYEGSNISAVVDLNTAFTNLMLYYLSQSTNQGDFDNTQIYENMNKIVTILNYNPVGAQTSAVPFRLFLKNLAANRYTIPRYYYVDLGTVRYSINEDLYVSKTEDDVLEEIIDIGKNKFLYQGEFIEHPILTANGEKNESVILTVTDNTIVDHFNIDVYVKRASDGKWHEFEATNSLYLSNSNDLHYQIRLNENKQYEIKFGDNFNGIKLEQGDKIAIYYLKSNGAKGQISTGALNGRKIYAFNTITYKEILNDVMCYEMLYSDSCNLLTGTNNAYVQNDCPSSPFADIESVDSIRKNAPLTSNLGQNQLIKTEQFNSFIKTNFSNVIHDVVVIDNEDFLQKYVKHYESLGLNNPRLENRLVHNFFKFSNSCNFNNLYAITVPKTVLFGGKYLNSVLKQLMKNAVKKEKCLTANFIPFDPIYVDLTIAYSFETVGTSQLQLETDESVIVNMEALKKKVLDMILAFFNNKNFKLGQILDLSLLNNQILNIEGVKNISTIDSTGLSKNGINIICRDSNFMDYLLKEFSNRYDLDDIYFPYFDTSKISTDFLTIK